MFKILEKKMLNPVIAKIVIEAPRIAKAALPGQFLIVRMVRNGGSLRIVGDAALQSAVEGGSTDAMNGISTVLGSE